ncbi:MAG: hypothetical protein ABEJ95_03920 [Candidatus Nanohalobium sp.]
MKRKGMEPHYIIVSIAITAILAAAVAQVMNAGIEKALTQIAQALTAK